VKAFLADHGAAADEIERAEAADVLDLLATDRLLVPAQKRYTVDHMSRLTGMEADVLRSFWRALGFADVGSFEQAFTDYDVEAIGLLKTMIDLGVTDVDRAIHMTRVIGASMARIADAIMAPVAAGPTGIPDTGNSSADAERYTTQHAIAVPITAKLLEFVWRRHAQAAVRRAMLVRLRGDAAALPALCVGFADMVGFTEISQQMSEDELAIMVGRFEEIAHDTVTARGGRLVKMIGDEAMFVADTALDGALIATSLAEAYAEDEMLSDVRVSLAFGNVLLQDGDYFGPTVNLASRSVGIARPGTVIVTSSFRDSLATEIEEIEELSELDTGHASLSEDESGFALRALRPRRLKGLGWVPLWVLERPGAREGSAEARASNRWDRLAEALKDLDEVREKGERLLAGDTGVLSASGLGDAERRDPEGS
jgi:class 3 adenylate cyclase